MTDNGIHPDSVVHHVSYLCPYCSGGLKAFPDSFRCQDCHKPFPVRNGIPQFVRDPNYYFGEVSQPRMIQLLKESKEEGWRPPFERMIREMKYGIDHRRYVLSERRAGWWPLLPFHPGIRVLDYGCGWGAISFFYARRHAEVTAYDLCLERLQFLQMRATSEGSTNIAVVQGGDAPLLPFANSCFDLVFLIGVLEWIPTSFDDPPLNIQKHYLREISRVLSPDGQLLVGIENRYNWYYFLGQREDHTHLRFVSLMPRPLANVYSRFRTGKPLRNLTHSYTGSQKLLRSSGFESSRIFLPIADYRHFNRVLDPKNPSIISDFFFERGKSNLESLKNWARRVMAPLLAPSFLVLGRRSATAPAFLDEFTQALSERLGQPKENKPRLTKYQVTRGDAVLLGYEFTRGGDRVIVHLPMNDAATLRCQFAQECLRRLRESAPPSVRPLVPTPLLSGELNGIKYFVQSMFNGYPATRFMRNGKFDSVLKNHAVSFLLKLSDSSTGDSGVADDWNRLVEPDLGHGLQIVEQNLGVSGDEIREHLDEQLSKRKWPVVIGHGDFWPGNLLLSKNGQELVGVIDWDRTIPRGMPLLDLIHFLLYPKVELQRRKLPDLVGEVLARGRFSDSDQPFVDSYLRQIGLVLTEDELRAFAVLYWLLNVGVSRTRGASDTVCEEDWINQCVTPASSWLREFVHPRSVQKIP
ncbi:MAG: methyltransferase domain-containing protein [Candidatus Acidiferrales bacterium]